MDWGGKDDGCGCGSPGRRWRTLSWNSSVGLLCCPKILVFGEDPSPPPVWILLTCPDSLPALPSYLAKITGSRLRMEEASCRIHPYSYFRYNPSLLPSKGQDRCKVGVVLLSGGDECLSLSSPLLFVSGTSWLAGTTIGFISLGLRTAPSLSESLKTLVFTLLISFCGDYLPSWGSFCSRYSSCLLREDSFLIFIALFILCDIHTYSTSERLQPCCHVAPLSIFKAFVSKVIPLLLVQAADPRPLLFCSMGIVEPPSRRQFLHPTEIYPLPASTETRSQG